MNEFLQELINWNPDEVSQDRLSSFVQQLNWSQLKYEDQVPEAGDPNNYSRNILLTHPVECVLIHWPPGVSSAVHLHDGYWGFVLVLEGACENKEFELRKGLMHQIDQKTGGAGAVLAEKNGVIHQLCNPSSSQAAISLHFYYPAFDSLQGMHLFDLNNRRIGILNDAAQTSSWQEPSNHFDSIREKAFEIA